MADNLLTIGTSGVLASTGLLNTTGNNISNLNSKGYVRQSTEYQSSILGLGVGKGTTNVDFNAPMRAALPTGWPMNSPCCNCVVIRPL